MTAAAPDRLWWTADEIAAAMLPDMPGTKRRVNALATRCDWRGQVEHARRRTGRGGGWEYHWSLFPQRAQQALIATGKPAAARAKPAAVSRDTAWAAFEALPEAVRDRARARLDVVQAVDMMVAGGAVRHLAVREVSRLHSVADRTIWSWFALIDGVDIADRLPYLAPRHRMAQRAVVRATCAPEFLDRLKTDYLRPGPHSFKSSYDRVVDWCAGQGLAVLSPQTARRWMKANVPRVTQVYAREGAEGLAKCFPPQIRDRSGLVAMEGVNADCHKIDVFVAWPGIDKPVRPQIVAFQDLYSNMILSWRVDLSPNKVAVMSAFGEMIEHWGIPQHCLFDNGREFANKWLTGGAETRFRFKIRDDDALGVLPQMGVKIHWATPGHGQAKPIERAFRDIADRVALDPRFAGAYVGKRPDAKPEDYGARAIPLEDFLRVLDEGVRAHNARPGRLSDTAKGRSFEQTFAESYARAPVRKATEAQQRLWLMGQEVRKLHATHGALTLHKNRYAADWMNEHAGQKIVARFDPENLHAGVYIYGLDGAFLGQAPCSEKVGFFDLVGAQVDARTTGQRRRAEKALLNVTRPTSVSQFASELDAAARDATTSPLVEAKVVELAPARIRQPLISRPLPVPDPEADARLKVFEADFSRPRATAPAAETSSARFWRMLDIERRAEAGEPVTQAEAEELARIQQLPEYRAQRTAYQRFGETAIG